MGAMSRSKGAKAERVLAVWLRTVGFGGAERSVRTGFNNGVRSVADPGDLTGTPGIVWSVKDVAEDRHPKWLAELDAMDGRPDDVRLLVHKRTGHADSSRWWCWMRLSTLKALTGAPNPRYSLEDDVPVRMELGHVIPLLHLVGYGDAVA
jgi:hypothetical protein